MKLYVCALTRPADILFRPGSSRRHNLVPTTITEQVEQRTVRHAPVHHHGAAYASLDGLDGGADLGDHAARRRAVLHQAVRVVDGEAGEQLALGRARPRRR